MEFSANGGNLSRHKNLVLYLYLSWASPYTRDCPGFMAKIYEGLKDDPIRYKIPLFHCRGTGHREQSTAFALIDLLLNRYNKTSVRSPLETWVLECETLCAGSSSLCVQVRDEGRSKEICLPSFRFLEDAPYFRTEHPTPVVYTAVPTIRGLEIQDQLKGYLDEAGTVIDVDHTSSHANAHHATASDRME